MIFSAPNRARFALLAAEMAREPLLLFTGAGASVDSGYPSWGTLLGELHAIALKQAQREERIEPKPGKLSDRITHKQWDYVGESTDPLWRAELYRKIIPKKEYERYLQETFGRTRALGDTAKLLAKFDFRHCLTTNYEKSIEEAWKREGKELEPIDWNDRTMVRKFFDALERKKSGKKTENASGRYLVYLHGRAHVPEGMVFTERDYIQRYVLSNDSYPRLLALFMFHRVLFVGFSMNDAQFQNIFRVANAHLGENPGGPGHYMLTKSETPEDPGRDELNAMMLLSKYGVSPIFYNPYDHHQGLKDILHELLRLMRYRGGGQFKQFLQKSAFANPQLPAPRLSLTASRPVSAVEVKTSEKFRDIEKEKPPLPLLNPNPNSEDGRKGMFGRSRRRGPFRLWAIVEKSEFDDDWFDIEMSVFRKDGKRFASPVTFYLHPTFSRSVVKVYPKKTYDRWEATLERSAWGAFTVGVVIGKDTKRMDRRLELDLAALAGAPAKFRSR